MKITIDSNAPHVGRYIGRVGRRQVPFALSRTVNALALSIKRSEQAKIGRYFELRTQWLKKRGAMPVKLSRKSQYPYIHATITVRDEVAALAATGGVHSAAGQAMAVPFSNVGDSLSTREVLNPARRTLPRSKWPSKILNKGNGKRSKGRARKVPKPFVLRSGGARYVVKRTSKYYNNLQFLYSFKKRVEIKKSWPLVENAKRNVDRNFNRRFRVELQRALLTAK